MKELRTTFTRLDTRVDNLPTRYEQARELIDAGHGPETPPAA